MKLIDRVKKSNCRNCRTRASIEIYGNTLSTGESIPLSLYPPRACATSATNCLGHHCTDACYQKDTVEPYGTVLWCRQADSAVIDLIVCPAGHWRKDKGNRPYPGFCHEDCTQFVGMPVSFLKDATKDYQYPVPHCCQTKTYVSALSVCPLGKPKIVREKTE